ncbi:MFS transporter [Micromonospora aurantiaca (nom. illeg.)]|uniref:MFS transporter n=1 Tax=Micromonospora aurantiaca (nom. illeg.) TaxID=47850 RepID=UPI000827962D|nr:MFS transporter [Micromonospora aurantiaca]SCL29520.1 drug resistance transporter, EmrB/QacA subfamily [Micromonospora aurantiaca]
MAVAADEPRSPVRRRWWALTLLCFVQFMLVVDDTVVNVALPSIREDLGYSATGLAWVVNGYLLAFGGLILLGGRAGDLVGHRRVFLAGVAVFAVASLACGVAQEPWQLVAARFLQGVGGALASPTALALITLIFAEGAERAKAIGLWGGIAALGGIVGYVLSGLLTDLVSWRLVFLINLPVAAVVLALVPALVPPAATAARQRVDIPGAVTATVGLAALVFALLEAPGAGWGSPRALVPLVVAVVLLAAFVLQERRVAYPLVPLRFFANRTRSAANGTMMLFTTGLFAMFFLLTLHVQERLGWSPLQTGLAYVPMAVCLLIGISLSQRLVGRLGPRPVLLVGPLLTAAGLLYLSWIDGTERYLPDILPGMMLVALGAGLAVPVLATAAMSATTAEDAGLGSGMLTVAQQIGGAVGLALLVSLAGLRSRQMVSDGAGEDAAAIGGTVLAFQVAAVILVAAALLTLVIRPPRPAASPDRTDSPDHTSIGVPS